MKANLALATIVFFSSAYAAQAVLVAEFLFDGTDAGIAVDTSGNGYDGTIFGGATRVPSLTSVTGTALDLDGVDDHVLLDPNTFVGMSETVSISTWVRWGDDHLEESTFFFGSSNATGIGGRQMQAHAPWVNGSLLWRAPGSQPGTNISAEVASSQTSGQWHHLVLTKDSSNGGGDIQIFVNNELRASATNATGVFNVVQATLGTDLGSPERAFDGTVDLFRVYDHELSETEIETLFTEPFPFEFTDFNRDSVVNSADYDILASNFLSETTSTIDGVSDSGDANLDGVVNLEDFVLWRSDFENPGISSASLTSGVVPEPSSLLILAGLVPVAYIARRRIGS